MQMKSHDMRTFWENTAKVQLLSLLSFHLVTGCYTCMSHTIEKDDVEIVVLNILIFNLYQSANI